MIKILHWVFFIIPVLLFINITFDIVTATLPTPLLLWRFTISLIWLIIYSIIRDIYEGT